MALLCGLEEKEEDCSEVPMPRLHWAHHRELPDRRATVPGVGRGHRRTVRCRRCEYRYAFDGLRFEEGCLVDVDGDPGILEAEVMAG